MKSPPESALHWFTDASGSRGCGGYCQQEWFQYPWTPLDRHHTITWQELYAVVIAAKTFSLSTNGLEHLLFCLPHFCFLWKHFCGMIRNPTNQNCVFFLPSLNHVVIHVDNQAVVYILKKMYAADPHLHLLLVQLMHLLMSRSIALYVRWIPTDSNVVADVLSREFPVTPAHLQSFNLNNDMSLLLFN